MKKKKKNKDQLPLGERLKFIAAIKSYSKSNDKPLKSKNNEKQIEIEKTKIVNNNSNGKDGSNSISESLDLVVEKKAEIENTNKTVKSKNKFFKKNKTN